MYLLHLDVEEAIQKNRKCKLEINKELEESVTNGKSNENTETQEKVSNVTTSEDAVKVVEEFEKIIKNKKSDIIWLAYHQEDLFQKFKEKEQFVSVVLEFGVGKSTIVLKVALFELINNYPKIKNSSLSLHYFKRYLKTIRQICKENAIEVKLTIKICLNFLAFSLNDLLFKM